MLKKPFDNVAKVKTLEDMAEIRLDLSRREKTVVLTNGCFDIVHAGHIHLFREARSHGDILIVAVNDDDSMTRLKGSLRPVFPLEERLEVLAAISEIDYLVSFSEDTPRRIVQEILPDVLVKGGDWRPDEVVGRSEVEDAGGKVIIVPYLPGKSTSAILKAIQALAESDQ